MHFFQTFPTKKLGITIGAATPHHQHHLFWDIFYKDNVIPGKIMKRERDPIPEEKKIESRKRCYFWMTTILENNENCSKILRKADREGDVLSYLFGGNET